MGQLWTWLLTPGQPRSRLLENSAQRPRGIRARGVQGRGRTDPGDSTASGFPSDPAPGTLGLGQLHLNLPFNKSMNLLKTSSMMLTVGLRWSSQPALV